LTGLTNAQVASFYLTLFGATGLSQTYAQIMAVALATYATSSTLAGGMCAQSFGFNVTARGSGMDSYNVGSDGTALGLSNNTSYEVSSLVTAADSLAAQGSSKLNNNLSSLNDLFNNINSAGGIS
jgi:hypothetical protein